MSKQMKKTIFGILGGIVLMLLIAYLPPETEMMSRQGWQYLGCFGFLLTCLISGALPDWVATLATMVMLLVFKLGKVADATGLWRWPPAPSAGRRRRTPRQPRWPRSRRPRRAASG